MTTPALVKSADLQRMVAVANSKGIPSWLNSRQAHRGFPRSPALSVRRRLRKTRTFDF